MMLTETPRARITGALLALLILCGTLAGAERVTTGLRALYTFQEGEGRRVRDRSEVGTPLDIEVERPGAVKWSENSLRHVKPNRLYSSRLPHKISRACERTGEITVEAWITPGEESQKGPARIISISRNASERNFTLGQEGRGFDARLRTSKTSSNGLPSVKSEGLQLEKKLTHVVYTRASDGQARLYVNGEVVGEARIAGRIDNWNETYRLVLGNEFSADRGWLGEYHLVALFSRALSAEQVRQNHEAGPGLRVEPRLDSVALERQESAETDEPAESKAVVIHEPDTPEHFDQEIAPLLARHCLECHNSGKKKGKVDLSSRQAVFPGPDPDSPLVVAGDPGNSLLIEVIESGEMPKDRPPLTERELALLKTWIDRGAAWGQEHLDFEVLTGAASSSENLLRRLTRDEYIETVRQVLGVSIEKEARELLPPDLRADGFSNTSYNLTVDLSHVEAFARLAETIAKRVDATALAREVASCQNLSRDCVEETVSRLGRRILRGPLSPDELEACYRIAMLVADEGGDHAEGLAYVIQVLVQSPRFLYRTERQIGDGAPRPVTDFELATRLSYMIWGGPPDDELLEIAARDELDQPETLGRQLERMLESPRARRQAKRFIFEWLDLGRLDHLRPGRELFPDWDPRLADDMRQETIAFFDEVAWKQDRPLTDLLTARLSFLTPRLARHYDLEPKGKELARYDLESVASRGGLLTHASVLTLGGDDASMVTRGLFVLHDLLGDHVGDPPPGLDTTPVPSRSGMSRRDVAQTRVVNPSCGGCHSRFEPLAYALEKYDGVGAHSERDEHDNTLREDGHIEFPGEEKEHAFSTSRELFELLASHDSVKHTIQKKIVQFALGRPLVEADEPHLEAIHREAGAGGGTYRAVIRALARSDLTLKTSTEPRP